jgi:IMP dehydrogenase/GMP reductase
MNNTKFDFDDILIQPSIVSDISSRSEVTVTYNDGYLPLFTAPMDTVVSENNIELFQAKGIRVVKPRTLNTPYSGYGTDFNEFISLGLDEFIKIYLGKKKNEYDDQMFILIDIANGHMRKLIDSVKKAKETYGDSLILMVGNIANPKTYSDLSEAGADFVRVGIGNGGGCLTTVQTGVGYPMASLIKECYIESCLMNTPAKIVADGGFKSYSDIIKALGLGADYVMLGSILNKALESAGDTYLANTKGEGWTEPGERINQYAAETENLFKYGTKMFKKFRGMSTKEAQKAMGKTELKTSEGVSRMQPVEYTLEGWTENFRSYLSSAMSYSDAADLKSFIGLAKFNYVTPNSLNRYKK